MSTLTRQSELEALLKGFHLPSFVSNYQQFARQSEKNESTTSVIFTIFRKPKAKNATIAVPIA
ncbi:MAG: hypothetical protein K2X93_00480 [Candidatus Obscuribacterales bacterium]|nr:hypothetical protein [Candidatus Obscuribacterales bacterium]